MVLHVFMLMIGFFITITALVSFVCFLLTVKDPSGGLWSFITFLVGATYIAVIAFVFMQLRVRDRKRELVASHPRAVTRALSDSEDVINRWNPDRQYESQSDFENGVNASDSDFLLSDSDTRHILQTSIIDDREMRARSSINGDPTRSPTAGRSSLNQLSITSVSNPTSLNGSTSSIYETMDEEGDDGLVGEAAPEDLDLDENILASQMSGHSPFQLSKLEPDSSCATSISRALVVFGFLIMAAIVILLFTFQMLATYQAVSMSLDTHVVPPTGRFYSGSDFSYFKMHLYCVGAATSRITPTVLIETDWGAVSYEWSMVTNFLLRQSNIRVCRYDRAGYGWSEPGPAPRDARTAASELSKILKDAGEVGPLVFVSYGFGTYISRIFTATTTSHTVAALVMIDAQHEKEEDMFAKAWGLTEAQEKRLANEQTSRLFQKKFLAPIGVPRLQMKASRKLNVIDQRKQIAAKTQFGFSDAVLSEFANMYGPSTEEVIQTRGTGFGDLPITLVLSVWRLNGTCAENRVPVDRCRYYEDSRDKLGDIPIQLQHDLLTLSTKSELVYAQESAFAHLDQPAFLADTIVNTIRRSVNITVAPL